MTADKRIAALLRARQASIIVDDFISKNWVRLVASWVRIAAFQIDANMVRAIEIEGRLYDQ